MEKIIPNNLIKELIAIPKNFDLDLIDQESGFETKIFPFVSRSQFESLESSNPAIYKKLARAGILFSFVLDIPRLKVYISNFGINQYDHDKARVAPWWDIRDLGLSWLKKANDNLFSALKEIEKDDVLKADNTFFQDEFELVSLFDFQKFYGIGKSPEVYQYLSDIMREHLDLLLMSLGTCTVEELKSDPKLKEWLQKYLKNTAICSAIYNANLLFINSGIVIQYEELPWQKSVILSPEQVYKLGEQFSKSADMYLQFIFDYMQKNASLFPCYQSQEVEFRTKIIPKKGGLFL